MSRHADKCWFKRVTRLRALVSRYHELRRIERERYLSDDELSEFKAVCHELSANRTPYGLAKNPLGTAA